MPNQTERPQSQGFEIEADAAGKRVSDEEHKSKLEGIKNGAEAVISAMSLHFPSLRASVRHLEKYGGAVWLLADDVDVGPSGTNPDDEERPEPGVTPDQRNRRSDPMASRARRRRAVQRAIHVR